MRFSAIIVAAGSGRRMGFDKLMAPLCGKPVLQHSIETFLQVDGLERLIVVTDKERFKAIQTRVNDQRLMRVDGGSERHESVAAGLKDVPSSSDFIAVHDAARPLIHQAQIEACLQSAEAHGAASSARKITETLMLADDEQRATTSVDRTHLWAMETPQIFQRALLESAYERVIASGKLVTDEVSALEHSGIKTRLVENSRPNLKITFPQDLPLAEHLANFRA